MKQYKVEHWNEPRRIVSAAKYNARDVVWEYDIITESGQRVYVQTLNTCETKPIKEVYFDDYGEAVAYMISTQNANITTRKVGETFLTVVMTLSEHNEQSEEYEPTNEDPREFEIIIN